MRISLKQSVIALSALATCLGVAQASLAGIVVIANQASPIAHVNKEDLRALYLQQPLRNAALEKVQVLDLDNDRTHNDFYKHTLNWSADQVSSYRTQKEFSADQQPPLQVSSDKALQLVGHYSNVISYIDTRTLNQSAHPDVKIIARISGQQAPAHSQRHATKSTARHLRAIPQTQPVLDLTPKAQTVAAKIAPQHATIKARHAVKAQPVLDLTPKAQPVLHLAPKAQPVAGVINLTPGAIAASKKAAALAAKPATVKTVAISTAAVKPAKVKTVAISTPVVKPAVSAAPVAKPLVATAPAAKAVVVAAKPAVTQTKAQAIVAQPTVVKTAAAKPLVITQPVVAKAAVAQPAVASAPQTEVIPAVADAPAAMTQQAAPQAPAAAPAVQRAATPAAPVQHAASTVHPAPQAATANQQQMVVDVVKGNQTLDQIADMYGVSVDQIRQWNHISNGQAIDASQHLKLILSLS